jgi:hypothetical protein
MNRLAQRITQTASSIDPFEIIFIFAGLGALISLIIGLDLALATLFSG